MDRDGGSEMDTLSITSPASVNVPSGSIVIGEPHLATIDEDIPLTTVKIKGKQDEVIGKYNPEPNEETPLLSSAEAGTEKSSSAHARNSKSFTSTFNSSQGSLFFASLQLSLHSSMALISQSLNGSFKQRSVSFSIRDREGSKTITLVEKLSDDARAPAVLAMWHVLNVIISSMPFAIALGGIAALPLTLLVGFLVSVTSVLLIDCLYEISPKSRLRKRVRASYADIGADVWGPIGGHAVNIMRIGLTYCSCVLRIMVLGNTLKDLTSGQVDLSLQEWCLVCTSALLLAVFIKRLSALAWLSMMAVLAALIIFFLLLGFSLSNVKTWKWGSILSFDMNTFPISMGIIVYSYCGHTVFPAVEGSMKNPKKYNIISHWAFSISTAMKFLVGLFCFLTFGTDTQSIVLLNLSTANASILSKIASILVVINMYFSYPVNMFVVSGTVDILLLPKFQKYLKMKWFNFLWLLSTRVILVYSTVGIALAVPRFGLLMSVFGSVLGVCVTLIFPCMFHLKLKWKILRWYNIAFELFIILFGVAAGMLGLIYSSLALKKALG